MKFLLSSLPFCLLFSPAVFADGPDFERLVVYGRQSDLIGDSISASEGVIGYGDIEIRPISRAGEILEFVPGMVVTQHSGSGKANQYFLRGFNLDHGTDFSILVDGMPVNMRSHGHGQGYSDLNFITPEFIQRIDYQKGPYRAIQGDFSLAGSANFALTSKFEQPFVKFELGEYGYQRAVAATNFSQDNSNLAVGAEWQGYAGPWTDIDEDINKKNMLIRYQHSNDDSLLRVTFMGYDNSWNSADQIPARAVASGLINEFGSLDTGLGGDSSRYSLSMNWQNSQWVVNAYSIKSQLNLFSNFTYYLGNSEQGDQFEQLDERILSGGSITYLQSNKIGSLHAHHMAGVEYRQDDISDIGLFNTESRQRIGTVRRDNINEQSLAAFYELSVDITDNLPVHIGVRHDTLWADVNSDLAANSGSENDSLVSIKGGVSYIINDAWQVYANAGQSFHSNDARGAVISVDPITLDPATPVDLLVRGVGSEIGIRVANYRYYNASFAVWQLRNDSELVFVGDAGNTEASRASKRWGAEFSGYYWFNSNLTADVELAWTQGRFTENEEGEGNYIDGSVPFVASLGLNWQATDTIRTGLRVRHFGKRTLDSTRSRQSDSFTVINANLAYEINNWKAELTLLNLLNSRDHDIDYWYASRLNNEVSEGVEDNHYHPIEPRSVRAGVTYKF
ncbi:TonB-dependent receptor [Alteromonas sp. AMM-1]|uniref:TonB-dependent receptor n=1 Tax=Alteromonas sp. AMM-1 TaxID=3394233 RepID=UPI0039A54353